MSLCRGEACLALWSAVPAAPLLLALLGRSLIREHLLHRKDAPCRGVLHTPKNWVKGDTRVPATLAWHHFQFLLYILGSELHLWVNSFRIRLLLFIIPDRLLGNEIFSRFEWVKGRCPLLDSRSSREWQGQALFGHFYHLSKLACCFAQLNKVATFAYFYNALINKRNNFFWKFCSARLNKSVSEV